MNAPGLARESCARCGYDLEGLGTDTPCPECACPRVPIDAFFHCPHCGYHLAGLPRDASCPECGNPASDAYVEYPLYRAGPAYLGLLASGAEGVLVAAALAALVFLIPWGLFYAVPLFARGGAGVGFGVLALFVLLVPLAICTWIIWFIGMLRITAEDPVYDKRAPPNNTRIACRGLSIALFCMPLAVVVPIVNRILFFAIPICAAVLYFCLTTYIERIAGRIPSTGLTKSATRSRTAGIWILSIVLFTVVAVQIESRVSRGNPSGLAHILGFVGWLLSIVLFVIYCRLIWRFARVLKECRERLTDTPRRAIPRPAPPRTPDGAPS